jgi:hypothetical protein
VLIEYVLTYKSPRVMSGQVIADFVVNHSIKDDEHIDYVNYCPWKHY